MDTENENEYNSLIEQLIQLVETELNLYTRNLILYGSYERVYNDNYDEIPPIIPGTSDLDLVLIVDIEDVNPEKPFLRYKKLAGLMQNFQLKPAYATILDLNILEASDLPPKITDTFTPIHAEAAARGTVLFGKNGHNILDDIFYSEKMLKKTATSIIRSSFESLRTSYLQQGLMSFFHGDALEFIASDSVLETSHALMAYMGKTNLIRLEIPDIFIDNAEFQDTFGDNITTVQRALEVRLGKKEADRNFIINALRFCRTATKFTRSPFSNNK